MVNYRDIQVSVELTNKLIEIRQHIHQYPELSFQEYKTFDYIASILKQWGIPYKKIGETGIYVDIIGENGGGPSIGIRADIDALPIHEQTNLPFSSVNQGVMHACGHDGHTAILLGTVNHLYRLRNKLLGRVRCIFQPGEEADGAAQQLIDLGVLESPNVDGMLALHLWPHLPHGTIGVKYGAITASCDDFVIEIEGESGHSARPHQAIDAITISSQIIQALHTLVTKSNNPVEPVVVHVGKIKGGTASNIVANHVVLEGTARAATYETRNKLKTQISKLCKQLATTFGGKATIYFKEGHPPVINNELMTRTVEDSALGIFGPDKVVHIKEISMGADDFGAFAKKVPSTYFRLGTAIEGKQVYDLHHPQFDFDDSILSIGVEIFTFIILNRLHKGVDHS